MKLARSVLAVSLAAVINPAAYAAPLETELKSLLATHPVIKAAGYNSRSADSGANAAISGYFPRVFVEAATGQEKISNYGYDDPENVTSSSAPVDTPSLSETKYQSASIRIEQPVYHFGRIEGAVELAEADRSIAEIRQDKTVQDVLLEGIITYLQVGRYKTLIDLAKQNEASTQEQLSLESRRVEQGGGIAVDALQAKTRLQVVRERSVFYKQQLRDTLAAYEQLFGRSIDLNRVDNVGLPESLLPDDAESAINAYLAASGDVRLANQQATRAYKEFELSTAAALPKLDLVGRVNKEIDKSFVSAKDEYSIGLRLTWNYSLGGAELWKADAARSSHNAALESAVAAANNFKQQVRITWNQLENGKERSELLENAVEIARDVMNDRKRLRDAGRETALAALDAEVEYYGVLANKVNAEFDTRIAAYRLLAALGALTPNTIGLNGGRFQIPVSPLETAIESL